MYESLFDIRDSTFSDNTADRNCGVICSTYSLFSINSSTFTNNSAADSGGVMITFAFLIYYHQQYFY